MSSWALPRLSRTRVFQVVHDALIHVVGRTRRDLVRLAAVPDTSVS